jgi:phage-related protein
VPRGAYASTCPLHRFRYTVPVAGTSKEKTPRLACRFYRTDAGSEPVRDWLKSLPTEVRQDIGSDIQQVQWRWPVGKPLVDGFGGSLFEVRTSFESEIYRVLFCLDGSTMVLLHGFKKKSQRTPTSELDLARKRQRKLEEDL